MEFKTGDRTRLTLLARLTQFWQSALHIVQPDTLLRWHRDMFRRYWKWYAILAYISQESCLGGVGL